MNEKIKNLGISISRLMFKDQLDQCMSIECKLWLSILTHVRDSVRLTFINMWTILTTAHTVEHNIRIITIWCYFCTKTTGARYFTSIITRYWTWCRLGNNLFLCEYEKKSMKSFSEWMIRNKKQSCIVNKIAHTSFSDPLICGKITFIA